MHPLPYGFGSFPAQRIETLDEFKESVDLLSYERTIAGDDDDRKAKFRNWWIDPIARSAWLEARGEPIEQGASDETG